MHDLVNPEASAALPHHVAIVMDGNGRWAKQRFLPRVAGHKKGVDALRRCIKLCSARGVKVLSVFAFSSENWRRPPDEVAYLMELFTFVLRREVPKMVADGVQLHVVGEREHLSDRIKAALVRAEQATAHCERLVLNICFNYGGRWDVVQAANQLVQAQQPITEAALASKLALAHVPDPDLLIRTGAEHRLSNFLMWQCAYSELYFSDVLWPDFDEAHFDQALASFAGRERRFGMLPEQMASASTASPTPNHLIPC